MRTDFRHKEIRPGSRLRPGLFSQPVRQFWIRRQPVAFHPSRSGSSEIPPVASATRFYFGGSGVFGCFANHSFQAFFVSSFFFSSSHAPFDSPATRSSAMMANWS